MQASDVPYKFSVLPGSSASGSFLTNPIPPTAGGAVVSQALLFPPDTAQVTGTPPSIQDMNGLVAYVGDWANWHQAGGPVVFDSTFSTNFGGYPKGAVVQSTTTFGIFWFCTVDDNTSDPDTGGANWIAFGPSTSGSLIIPSTASFVVPVGATYLDVEAWGPGGSTPAGYAVGTLASGGAGSGGYSKVRLTGLAPGTSILATIGTPGAPGVTGVSVPTNGSATTFGSHCTAGSALFNTAWTLTDPTASGAPGTASGGDVNITGSWGTAAFQSTNGAGNIGGSGGAAPCGGGATSGNVGAALDGSAPGGGASGVGAATTTGKSGATGGIYLRWG